MLKSMMFSGGGAKTGSFVATLDSQKNKRCNSVTVAPDGSIYICGEINSGILLAKFNSSGEVQWQRTLDSGLGGGGNSVAVAPDGSVYICGYATTIEYSASVTLLAKFNSSGEVQWQKTLGDNDSNNSDVGNSVAVAPDGSVYICGSISSRSILLAKFNSSGEVQWQRKLGNGGGNSVAVAPDGSVYICGSDSSNSSNIISFLAKFNSSGKVQWQRTLSGVKRDYGHSVAVAPDGSVYTCGYTTLSDEGNDLSLAKFNSSGEVQWQRRLGGDRSVVGLSVAVAPDGSVYVCGYSYSTSYGSMLLLAKFNSSGEVQWQRKLGNGEHYGRSVAVAPDGSIYACGYTEISNGNNYFLLAKITESLIEKDNVTFGDLTFKDASLTLNITPLNIKSSSISVSNFSLTLNTSSLTIGTPSLATNLYTYKE